ncbi:hypothetical protein PAMA_010879 [Pampus argenteus]
MDTRWADINQVTLSATTLKAMFKNQSEEIEAVKENAEHSASSRADEHVVSVEALNAQLERQATIFITELVEVKQAMRAQALEEMLSSVRMLLNEQFFTSKTFHRSIMAQLQTEKRRKRLEG